MQQAGVGYIWHKLAHGTGGMNGLVDCFKGVTSYITVT